MLSSAIPGVSCDLMFCLLVYSLWLLRHRAGAIGHQQAAQVALPALQLLADVRLGDLHPVLHPLEHYVVGDVGVVADIRVLRDY